MASDDMALWKPPTRRSFVALLGAGMAAIWVAVRFSGSGSSSDSDSGSASGSTDAEPEQRLWAGKTRWIGHG